MKVQPITAISGSTSPANQASAFVSCILCGLDLLSKSHDRKCGRKKNRSVLSRIAKLEKKIEALRIGEVV